MLNTLDTGLHLTLPASLPLSPQKAELGPLIRGPGSSHLASPDAGMGLVPAEWPQMRPGCLSSPLRGGPLDVSTTRSPGPDLSLLRSHLWRGPDNQEEKTTWVSESGIKYIKKNNKETSNQILAKDLIFIQPHVKSEKQFVAL